ncbi:modification methylase [Helicobacter ailurogastricus]|uniref:modification methylase n=1 Tax=Helicobacter ailurogastricus TaxID=1578720 RepID=UPI0022CA71A0|nr:modification methylase [Helicobacter ailurogastricus]GLH58574.1 DNA modification methylase [Helicobacter ailurogastricus]GLH60240.1 DNA modification methylase [Helicobacter ailurogastricus]
MIASVYNQKYDFVGQSYASFYPNLHKYPATMLPQIGLELLQEFGAQKTNLLDPYCGSGSSFISALEYGIEDLSGFDLNPLAILISRAKLSYIDKTELLDKKERLLESMTQRFRIENAPITNAHFWIEEQAQQDLSNIFYHISRVQSEAKTLFLLAFSETLREVSYTRNNEFKLFRMKDYQNYKPNTYGVFYHKIETITKHYLRFYQRHTKNIVFDLCNFSFQASQRTFDTLLTSPPYGDSKTTVAYGQFSAFINEWLGFENARKLDSQLLGGLKAKTLYTKGSVGNVIQEIAKLDARRALEVSSFYDDLERSIQNIMPSLAHKALIFFVVGNRRVKNFILPTDRFIVEVLCACGCKHLSTLERKISNKSMPLKNSPTNRTGLKSKTMDTEKIVVCQKK